MSGVVITGSTKRFEGKPPTVAVDDLSLAIDAGEFLVLLGPQCVRQDDHGAVPGGAGDR